MEKNSIWLDHLTHEQVDMLNILWSLAEWSDVEKWQSTLSEEDRQMSDSLIRLIVLESADEIINDDLSEANEVLKKFTLKA